MALAGQQRPIPPHQGTYPGKPVVTPTPSDENEIQEAKELLQAGATGKAISALRRVLRRNPSNADAHLMLGAVMALVPERDEALVEFQRALALQPRSAHADYVYGTALARFGEVDAARAMFEKALQLSPQISEARVSLALVLAQEKRFSAAADQLARAISIQGSSPDAAYSHYLLGQVLIARGQLEKATQELETSIRLRPQNADAYLSLGLIKKKLHDDPGALAAFKQATLLAPDNADAQYQLGEEYVQSGKATQAIGPFRKASEIEPTNRKPLYQLCRALEMGGKHQEARVCQRKLSPLIHEDLNVADNLLEATRFNNEGVELEKSGHLSAALAKYQAAVKLDPSQTVFRRNMGLVLCHLGRWDDGIVELRQVLKQNPDDVRATKALYIALDHQKKGKKSQAGNKSVSVPGKSQ